MDIYELNDALRGVIEEDREVAPQWPPMIAIPPFKAVQTENEYLDPEVVVIGVTQENSIAKLDEDPNYVFVGIVFDGECLRPRAFSTVDRDSLPYGAAR